MPFFFSFWGKQIFILVYYLQFSLCSLVLLHFAQAKENSLQNYEISVDRTQGIMKRKTKSSWELLIYEKSGRSEFFFFFFELQMQFLREKKFKQRIPKVKVDGGEKISYEKVTDALKRATYLYSSLQAIDGHWPSGMTGPLFIHPPLVSHHPSIIYIFCYMALLTFTVMEVYIK